MPCDLRVLAEPGRLGGMSSAVRPEPAGLLVSWDFGGLFAPHRDGVLQQLRAGSSGLLESKVVGGRKVQFISKQPRALGLITQRRDLS